jgi:hypothetical protein
MEQDDEELSECEAYLKHRQRHRPNWKKIAFFNCNAKC